MRALNVLASAIIIGALVKLGYIPNPIELCVHIFPLVPSNYVHQFGYHLYWFLTSIVHPALDNAGITPFEDCFDNNDSNELNILLTALKSGSVLSALVGYELAAICGMSASPTQPSIAGGWPNVSNPPPSYPVDLFIGIGNPVHWEDYLNYHFNDGRPLNCVVFTRNPFKRLLSLYKYSKDSGERGLRKVAKGMSEVDTTKERFEYLWNEIGEKVMVGTHIPLAVAVKDVGCTQISLDDLMKSSDEFDKAMTIVLDTFNVKKQAHPTLLEAFAKNDLNRQSKEEREANRHVSGKTLEAGEADEVRALMHSNKEVEAILLSQCKDLGYEC